MNESDRERVTRAVLKAVEDVNEQLPSDRKLPVSTDTVLFDESQSTTGGLDSLGLVNLIVATEERVEEEFDVAINLTDDWDATLENDPFRSVETFAAYIGSLVETARGE